MPTTPPSLPEVPTIPSEPQGEVDRRLKFDDVLRLSLSEPQPPLPAFTHPLTGREVFKDADNPDFLMTEKSVDFEMDGKYWYAPSIYDGVYYSGGENLGKII